MSQLTELNSKTDPRFNPNCSDELKTVWNNSFIKNLCTGPLSVNTEAWNSFFSDEQAKLVDYYLKTTYDIDDEEKASYVMTETLRDVFVNQCLMGPDDTPTDLSILNYYDFEIKVHKDVSRYRFGADAAAESPLHKQIVQVNVYCFIDKRNGERLSEMTCPVDNPLVSSLFEMNDTNAYLHPAKIIGKLLRYATSEFDIN